MLILFSMSSEAQKPITVPENRYGLKVIDNQELYSQTIFQDSSKKMVNLKKVIPELLLDLRYATTNNFTNKRMYPKQTCETYLRLPVAKALLQVQQELSAKGLGLKIFDAYRPYHVTEKFWELIHDDRYVADPSKGSGHNRGIAVDLTIIRLQDQKELKMGTGFDDFSDTAHHSFIALSDEVLNNRKMFCSIMEKYGFKKFDTEWWHYSWPNPEYFEILDLDIAKGKKYFGE